MLPHAHEIVEPRALFAPPPAQIPDAVAIRVGTLVLHDGDALQIERRRQQGAFDELTFACPRAVE